MSKATYTYDEKSLLRNGKRWFPVMGEIHYSRYPNKYWKEALYKMKAGGVNIVSSYVLWIHHEEIENQWDWTGDRNLRKFVETIKECGLSMILRIGPWCHAETRNGGFPDWLLEKCPDARTNDESYFKEVEKLYKEIYAQVKGLLLKDGGPIIGLQIENEYGHCGGLCGELQAGAEQSQAECSLLWAVTVKHLGILVLQKLNLQEIMFLLTKETIMQLDVILVWGKESLLT